MTVFADSSALVKLYVPEAQYRTVRRIAEPFVISALARAEVPAAFWRKHRVGEISIADAVTLSAVFAADEEGAGLDAPRFSSIAPTERVLRVAARAIARHPLRAYDAVQLASALLTREALGEMIGFATFDRTLRSAAAAEGFRLVPEAIEGGPH